MYSGVRLKDLVAALTLARFLRPIFAMGSLIAGRQQFQLRPAVPTPYDDFVFNCVWDGWQVSVEESAEQQMRPAKQFGALVSWRLAPLTALVQLHELLAG